MKARLPQGYNKGDMRDLLKQAQQAQADMATKQEEIEGLEFTATAGGNMVEIVATGNKKVKSIKLKPEVVDPEDIEMLEDLVTAAVNEVMNQIDETMEKEMGDISGALGMPGIPGL